MQVEQAPDIQVTDPEPIQAKSESDDSTASTQSLVEPKTINGYSYLSLLSNAKIDQALNNGDLVRAKRLAQDLPQTSKEALAIALKLQLVFHTLQNY